MKTLFDIGDEIGVTLKGKVVEYSASKDGDCYTIELTHPRNQHSRVYLSSSDLYDAKRITDELNAIQERIEDVFAYLAVCRQMEAMLPERIEILEMGLRALEEKIRNSHKEENVMIITAKIESMNHIPKTCSECKLQSDDRKCPLLLDAHQSCPVTFHPELFDAATEKMEDGTTVIDVLKTGRRCLCPLEEKSDEG